MLFKSRKHSSNKAAPYSNELVRLYFDVSAKQFGNSVSTVGWYSRKTQEIRFVLLSLIGNLNQQRVLDVGCGLGDLHEFFIQHQIQTHYTGIDISSEMIRLAQKNHPDITFEQKDFLDPNYTKKYDYVFASGTLNYKMPNLNQYIQNSITKLFSLCTKGIAFNLLSAYAPEKHIDPETFGYYYPEDILKTCFALTPHVVLKHHYLPNDFTVYMLKRAEN